MPRLSGQPPHVRLRVVPVNTYHRVPIGLLKAGILPIAIGAFDRFLLVSIPRPAGIATRVARLPRRARILAPRHLVHAHRKRLAEGHPLLRTFIIESPCLTRQRSHHERPCGYHDQLRASRTILKMPAGLHLWRSFRRFPRCLGQPLAGRRCQKRQQAHQHREEPVSIHASHVFVLPRVLDSTNTPMRKMPKPHWNPYASPPTADPRRASSTPPRLAHSGRAGHQ